MAAIQVFTNQTTDGASAEFTLNGDTRIKVTGDLGGGTIDLQSKSDNANDSFATTGTNNIIDDSRREVVVKAQQRWTYRLVLSGSTSPSIDAFVGD